MPASAEARLNCGGPAINSLKTFIRRLDVCELTFAKDRCEMFGANFVAPEHSTSSPPGRRPPLGTNLCQRLEYSRRAFQAGDSPRAFEGGY